MFSRRGILGLFGGLLSWFTAKKVVVAEPVITAVAPHPAEGYIQLPDWCPEGWVPMMGQNICKEQFPYLFEPNKAVRKNGSAFQYLPPFHGLEIAPLPIVTPTVPSDSQDFGWVDRLTYLSRKEKDNKIVVYCMSTKPLVSSNGRVWQAGFCAAVIVTDRDKFEEFYGTIKNGGPSPLYVGEPVLEHYPFHGTYATSCSWDT